MLRFFATALLFLAHAIVFAQIDAPRTDPFLIRGPHLGVGLGQDVGGIIGARFTYWPVPYAAAFVGGGWAVVGTAYNCGLEFRVPTQRRASPFAVAMYGYNAVVQVQGKEELNSIYYGPTIGAGIMLRQRITRNYWRFSINLPFRSPEVFNDIDEIKQRSDIEVKSELIPITIGVGFHLCLAPVRE